MTLAVRPLTRLIPWLKGFGAGLLGLYGIFAASPIGDVPREHLLVVPAILLGSSGIVDKLSRSGRSCHSRLGARCREPVTE